MVALLNAASHGFRREMMKDILMRFTVALALTAAAAGVYPLRAQSPQPTLQCEPGSWRINGLDTFCKIVDQSAEFIGSLSVKSGNGAIAVRGWDEPNVFVRARIDTAASSVFGAAALA